VDARAAVRSGPIVESIEGFLRESCASTLVIGEPKVTSALDTFRLDRVQSCADQMEDDTGTDVVVVPSDSEE
jgi:hypothetical protein